MNYNKLVSIPKLKCHVTTGAFVIDLGLELVNREVMKIVEVCEDSSLEACLHPSCTSDMLRLIHQQHGNINNMKETCESNEHRIMRNVDVVDIAHLMRYNKASDKVTNNSGIDHFFYIRFKLSDCNDASNVDDNEECCPCGNGRWRPSCSQPS